jgi:hypothetical protein
MQSRLAQNEVDHPTTSNVIPRLAAVVQDVGIVAATFFESIGKDGHKVEGTYIVDALG